MELKSDDATATCGNFRPLIEPYGIEIHDALKRLTDYQNL